MAHRCQAVTQSQVGCGLIHLSVSESLLIPLEVTSVSGVYVQSSLVPLVSDQKLRNPESILLSYISRARYFLLSCVYIKEQTQKSWLTSKVYWEPMVFEWLQCINVSCCEVFAFPYDYLDSPGRVNYAGDTMNEEIKTRARKSEALLDILSSCFCVAICGWEKV